MAKSGVSNRSEHRLSSREGFPISVFFKDFKKEAAKILEKILEFFSPLRGENSWKKILKFFSPLHGEKSWKNDWKTNWDLKIFVFFEEKMQISIKESIKNAWKLQKSWNLSRWKCLKKNLEIFCRFAAKFLKKILEFFSPLRGENSWIFFNRRFAAAEKIQLKKFLKKNTDLSTRIDGSEGFRVCRLFLACLGALELQTID